MLVIVACRLASAPCGVVTVTVWGQSQLNLVNVMCRGSARTSGLEVSVLTLTLPVGSLSRDRKYLPLKPGGMRSCEGVAIMFGGLASVMLRVSAAIPSTLYPSPCTSWVMSTVRVLRLPLYGIVRVTVALGSACPAANRITSGDAFTPERAGTRTVTATEDSGVCPSRNS